MTENYEQEKAVYIQRLRVGAVAVVLDVGVYASYNHHESAVGLYVVSDCVVVRMSFVLR